MSIAVLFGLCSAICYGAADFLSHFANKRSGVLRTMIYAQTALAVGLSAGLIFVRHSFSINPFDWAILIVSDFCILIGTACLYSGLATGNLAIVPPVAACYGAVAALPAIIGGEGVGVLPCIGLALAVAGGVVTAIPSKAAPIDVPRHQTSGTLLAAAAALLYGGGFWMQGRFSVPVFGIYVPVWSCYLLGSFGLAAFAADRSLPSQHEIFPTVRDHAPRVWRLRYAGCWAAAAVVLTPGAPLGLLTNAVQTLAGVLLLSATVFLLLLCNDKAVLGPWVNGRWLNLLTGGIVAVLVLLSVILTARCCSRTPSTRR